MRVLDAMASELAALKERIEMAESRIRELQGGCSCQTWRQHTGIPRDDAATTEPGPLVDDHLTSDEIDFLVFGEGV